MVEKLYDILQTPKDIVEIQSRLNESGISWNKHQIRLFLEMDKNVVLSNGMWCVNSQEDKNKILDTIKQLLKERPIIPIKRIIDNIEIKGYDESKILKIALDTGDYISPNGKTLKRK
ncbi:hypothetical protein SAMN02745120_0079 [Acetoanaerobium noterae]|uniref:Uncharacterized protein n=1 Tax=Acetoanaerobium noterae TaxID=745369 RepID=A0A1T5DN46_9FIRM|nr:hypothetical protein [Acetoanaerobium noterae]SKB72913.1 hypothetical protein SAMN02745120_0079 [Acetoanaerobium noterae]